MFMSYTYVHTYINLMDVGLNLNMEDKGIYDWIIVANAVLNWKAGMIFIYI